MNGSAQQFPFVTRDPAFGSASLAPMVPLTLKAVETLEVSALLDTGTAVNVVPYSVGARLGFLWDQQTTSLQLSGNLASVEARVVLVQATVAPFAPVRLAFAWAKQDSIPIILGQVNFFMEFDVCFFRAQSFLEVRPKS